MRKIVYVKRKKKALICINPKCVEVDEKKVAQVMVQSEARHQAEHPHVSNMYGAICANLTSLANNAER